MDKIDTHQVELAFDELIGELSKLKDLNNLVDSYKDTVDILKQKVSELVEHIESFYKCAKEHDSNVNEIYNQYVCKSDEIITFLKNLDSNDEEFYEKLYSKTEAINALLREMDSSAKAFHEESISETKEIMSTINKRIMEQERVNRRVSLINLLILIISSLAFLGVLYLIFAK